MLGGFNIHDLLMVGVPQGRHGAVAFCPCLVLLGAGRSVLQVQSRAVEGGIEAPKVAL